MYDGFAGFILFGFSCFENFFEMPNIFSFPKSYSKSFILIFPWLIGQKGFGVKIFKYNSIDKRLDLDLCALKHADLSAL